jgi:hypothetical protein
MCRKKETEREKVQPFIEFVEETRLMEAEVAAAAEVEASNVLEEKHRLANFHNKLNKVRQGFQGTFKKITKDK